MVGMCMYCCLRQPTIYTEIVQRAQYILGWNDVWCDEEIVQGCHENCCLLAIRTGAHHAAHIS